MAQYDKSGFESVYQSTSGTFADNSTRQITEGDMRQFADDIADSVLFISNTYDTIQFIIDGGGSVITSGVKGDILVPFNCQIEGWDLVADISGSITIDIWQDTYANFPPTVADTIVNTGTKPALSSAIKNTSSALTNWTTTLTKDKWLRFNAEGTISSVTRVTIALKVKRTA